MPQIVVKKAFTYWHRGVEPRDYQPGDAPVETDADCAAVAVAEGWALQPGHKATAAAPENKDAAPKRRTKA
jgi:hypothetical protein